MENHNYMLIADDAGEFRDTCKAALEAKGFEVEVCRKDGRALLDMIREKKPTAVLMEALMSGLDGLGVLMAVSRGECGVQPTIFTMTGMDAPGITNQLIRAGSAYHFVKPFDPDIIAERVEMLFLSATSRLPRAALAFPLAPCPIYPRHPVQPAHCGGAPPAGAAAPPLQGGAYRAAPGGSAAALPAIPALSTNHPPERSPVPCCE